MQRESAHVAVAPLPKTLSDRPREIPSVDC